MTRGKLICRECGATSYYRIMQKAGKCNYCGGTQQESVHPDDSRRVSRKLCPKCFRAELKAQLFDEVGGILGNLEYHGEETLVALAKALVRHGLTGYYQASEYLVFQALKDNQNPVDDVLMMPDGDKTTLSKKVVK